MNVPISASCPALSQPLSHVVPGRGLGPIHHYVYVHLYLFKEMVAATPIGGTLWYLL